MAVGCAGMSYWHWSILGALGIVVGLPIAGVAQSVPSNIVPDDTLGVERSQVEFRPSSERITGGAVRGANLFHSFREFNVGEGRSSYFVAPSLEIENIFARVTGGNRSDILGELGTARLVDDRLRASNANLFLMNPNGILFGQNSSLDVDRSLFITTASGIQFGEQGEFSATRPEVPPALLTIQPSAFLFNQIPGDIVVRANQPIEPDSSIRGLKVPSGELFQILGGNINIDGSRLNAWGGRVEIIGIQDSGKVELDSSRRLDILANIDRADILFTNGARVDVSLGSGGEIKIIGRSINIFEGSLLQAGIANGFESSNRQVGDLILDASDGIKIIGKSSRIENNVNLNSIGSGGSIRIKTKSLIIDDEAEVSTTTFGRGDAGNITIDAADLVSSNNGGIYSSVAKDGIGKGGKIHIKTNSLNLVNGSLISSSSSGKGDAGEIKIEVQDDILINGTNSDDFPSSIRSRANKTANGNGGNIYINARELSIFADAEVNSSTLGKGNAGNININSKDRIVLSNGDIFSNVEEEATGNGGNIQISTDSLELNEGSELTADSFGNGRAGDIVLSLGDLSIIDGGGISASTTGQGDAGDIVINVRNLTLLSGQSSDKAFSSIASIVTSGAVGNGGNLNLSTGQLSATDRAIITTATGGIGNAGELSIIVRDSALFDAGKENGSNSLISTSVLPGGSGNAGSLKLLAGSLTITNGAKLDASTSGQGNAGNVIIHVNDGIILSGEKIGGNKSSVISYVNKGAVGNGGSLSLSAGSLNLSKGARLSTSTFGRGNAGNISINIRSGATVDGESLDGLSTEISSEVESGGMGNAGELSITAGSLAVTNGAQLSSSSSGRGNAGNLVINVREMARFDGERLDKISSKASSQVNRRGIGNAGNLSLSAGSLFVTNGAQISTSVLGEGNSGDIMISVQDTAIFDGKGKDLLSSGVFSNVQLGARGDSGNLTIFAEKLSISNNAVLSSASIGRGNTGSISATANEINVDTSGFIEALSIFGNAANINLNAEKLHLNKGYIETTSSSKNGGNISLNISNILILRQNSSISTSSSLSRITKNEDGNGGNIDINSRFIIAIPRENSDITANAVQGVGGKIQINAKGIFGLRVQPKLTELSDITAISGIGLNGLINLNVPDSTAIQNNLNQLATDSIDTNKLLAQTCLIRKDDPQGTFYITGTGNLPNRPNDLALSDYPTNTIQTTPKTAQRPWKLGDPIIEPQGFYKLTDGRFVMSRECSSTTQSLAPPN
jgi:filamentous hemagglutinin family protein